MGGGFTLVELLVVIAIIGVLGAVAPPADNNYSLKSKFTDCAPNAAALASAAPATPPTMASLPCVGGSGCAPSTKCVASVSCDSNGVITGTAATSSGLKGETVL